MSNNFYVNFSEFHFNDDNSFTCKAPKTFECSELESLAIALLWEPSLDFNLSGEDGCINNFDMYTPLYNLNNCYEYVIPYSVAERWENGEEVTIHGKQLSEEELESVRDFMDNY